MRRKVTLNLDEGFIERMDRERGLVPRSRWIEIDHEALERSPRVVADSEPARGRGPVVEPEGYVSPFVGPGAKASNLKDVI